MLWELKSVKGYISFGKKKDNTYRIIERKYKNGDIGFFVEVTNNGFEIEEFDMTFPDVFIHNKKAFKSLQEAVSCVDDLKEEDKKLTVLEETIHEVN